jgi:hypothetical protein
VQQDYHIERMPHQDAPARVFDTHVHYPWREHGSTLPGYSARGMIDMLAYNCQRLNIYKVCLLGRPKDGNDLVGQAVERYPNLVVPFAMIEIDQTTPEMIVEFAKRGLKGQIINPRNHDDPTYFPCTTRPRRTIWYASSRAFGWVLSTTAVPAERPEPGGRAGPRGASNAAVRAWHQNNPSWYGAGGVQPSSLTASAWPTRSGKSSARTLLGLQFVRLGGSGGAPAQLGLRHLGRDRGAAAPAQTEHAGLRRSRRETGMGLGLRYGARAGRELRSAWMAATIESVKLSAEEQDDIFRKAPPRISSASRLTCSTRWRSFVGSGGERLSRPPFDEPRTSGRLTAYAHIRTHRMGREANGVRLERSCSARSGSSPHTQHDNTDSEQRALMFRRQYRRRTADRRR